MPDQQPVLDQQPALDEQQPVLDEQQQADVARAAEAVAGALREAVQATIAEQSPEPARQMVLEIAASGGQSKTEDGGNPAAMMTTYLLLHLLSLVREELAEQPDRVAEILTWVEANLGKRYRLRARYTSVALESAPGVDEIAAYVHALGSEFMPSMIWLLAGAVARYGDGDAEWLQKLQAAHVA